MSMCSGGDHALRSARGLIKDQRRVIDGLRNRLKHHGVTWPLDPIFTAAAITGVKAPGLNPRELDLNSRLYRFFAQRLPDVISLGSAAGFQLPSLRISSVGSSSSGVSPSEGRSVLINPIPIERPLPLSPSSKSRSG